MLGVVRRSGSRNPLPPSLLETPRLEPLTLARLDAVLAVEQGSYARAWSRQNFLDSLRAGYWMQCLARGDTLLGYVVAMAGYREMHLLKITVARDWRGQGWARVMLQALELAARAADADALWLEVRASNQRALQVYRRQGFREVGRRPGYYPVGRSGREDAVLMTLDLRREEAAS